jgi:hypothetical protein
MTANTRPERTWHFQPREAIYIAPYGAYKRPVAVTPAVVTKVKGEYVTMIRADGARRTMKADNLVHRGYCEACRVPAILDGAHLVCPRCERKAVDAPPPDDIMFTLYTDPGWQRRVRESLLTGCTLRETYGAIGKRDADAFHAMLEQHGLYAEWLFSRGPWRSDSPLHYQMDEELERAAILGDADAFKAIYERYAERARGNRVLDGFLALCGEDMDRVDALLDVLESERLYRATGRAVSVPVVERPADDAEPDGPDEVTSWLERQFKQAA